MDVMVYAALCQEKQEHDAAYALLRYAVKRLFDLPELPEIVKEEKGKPYFPQYSQICFNLSHSYGAVVCAVHDRPIGVDVEKVRPAPRRLAKDMGDTDFFLLWTAMEATIKRDGQGWSSLLARPEPDALCRCSENLLPGWIITVCPSEEENIRWEWIEHLA